MRVPEWVVWTLYVVAVFAVLVVFGPADPLSLSVVARERGLLP